MEERPATTTKRLCTATGMEEDAASQVSGEAPASPGVTVPAAATTETTRGVMGVAATAASWADLPADCIVSIVSLLPPCVAERFHVSCLNRHWRDVVKARMQLPPQLPWLLLPSTSDTFFHSSIGRRWHTLHLPDDIKTNYEIRGSSEGSWLILAGRNEAAGNLVYNIATRQGIELPSSVEFDGEELSMEIDLAVLSNSPGSPWQVVAAVHMNDRPSPVNVIAMWQDPMRRWEAVATPGGLKVLDMIRHQGAYFILTDDEDVWVLSNLPGRYESGHYQVKQRCDFAADDRNYNRSGFGEMYHYLVESGEDLIMAVKYEGIDGEGTFDVRVFRLHVGEEPEDDGYDDDDKFNYGFDSDMEEDEAISHDGYWINLQWEVPGRMLFLGHGSSRSFETDGDSTIFFLDYRCAEVPGIGGQYYRDDMGKFSSADMWVEKGPMVGADPLPPPTSDRSPPAWWLH